MGPRDSRMLTTTRQSLCVGPCPRGGSRWGPGPAAGPPSACSLAARPGLWGGAGGQGAQRAEPRAHRQAKSFVTVALTAFPLRHYF